MTTNYKFDCWLALGAFVGSFMNEEDMQVLGKFLGEDIEDAANGWVGTFEETFCGYMWEAQVYLCDGVTFVEMEESESEREDMDGDEVYECYYEQAFEPKAKKVGFRPHYKRLDHMTMVPCTKEQETKCMWEWLIRELDGDPYSYCYLGDKVRAAAQHKPTMRMGHLKHSTKGKPAARRKGKTLRDHRS